MKKKVALLLPLIGVITLSGCDIFQKILDMYYPDLETYFKENNYTDSSDVNNFNDVMGQHVYFWSKKIQTYTNSNNSSIVYDSPRGDHITHFENNKQITIYSRYAEKIVLMYKEDDTLPIRYSSEQGDNIRMKNDGKLYYVSDKSYLVEVDEEHSHILQVQQDDNGYLLVSHLNFMVYVSKDFTKFYINTENTATFTNYEGSLTVPESDLLTASLAKCQKRDNLFIPVPENYTNHLPQRLC